MVGLHDYFDGQVVKHGRGERGIPFAHIPAGGTLIQFC
jgi:hypothetical protein